MCRNTMGARLTPSARRGEDVVGLPLGEHLSAQQPGEDRDLRDADRDDHAGQVRVAEQHADRDGQQQAGNRQHDVDDPHHHGVHPAAERAGQQAQDQPADQPDQGGEDADQQGLPAPDDHPGEQVAALGVAAEREPGLRRGDGVAGHAEVWPIEQLGSRVVRWRSTARRRPAAGTARRSPRRPRTAVRPGAGARRRAPASAALVRRRWPARRCAACGRAGGGSSRHPAWPGSADRSGVGQVDDQC